MSPNVTQSPQSLPTSHFLSLPPSFAPTLGSSSTSTHVSNGSAPNTASLAAADFDVDVRTGFLPGTTNVARLPSAFALWEEALDAALGKRPEQNGEPSTGLTLGGRTERDRLWRLGIEQMPVLPADDLDSLPLLRRAHLVLTFLLHFYVHSLPSASTKNAPLPIPRSLSIPLSIVSPKVGLPPVLTYADTVLYNFHAAKISAEPSYAANPPTTALATFTGTRSEEQFFVISALCEIAGAEALRLMRQSLDELFVGDALALRRLTGYLKKLAAQIDCIGDITLSMMQHIDPEEFYHLIRPWFRGGDGDGPASKGWDYLGVDEAAWGEGENVERNEAGGKLFSGPSAGQSSLIHAIDIFLTVDHTESPGLELNHDPISGGDTAASINSGPDAASSKPNEATFVQRMLQYMPRQHRNFLLHLASTQTPLRPTVVYYAQSHPKLANAYDGALEALKRFREKHMRIVSLYIVQQARRPPSERIRRILGLEEEVAEVEMKSLDLGEMRGTGGSPLFKFLKRCRDNTSKAMIGKPAGPGFDLS